MPGKIILGLSIGAQTTGFAIIKDRKLVDFKVSTYRGKWSAYKRTVILSGITKYVLKHGINGLAIKIPNPNRSSIGVDELVAYLIRYAQKNNLWIDLYTISELEALYSKEHKMNKGVLLHTFMCQYPALMPTAQKELEREREYYTKIFEAVAAAQCGLERMK